MLFRVRPGEAQQGSWRAQSLGVILQHHPSERKRFLSPLLCQLGWQRLQHQRQPFWSQRTTPPSAQADGTQEGTMNPAAVGIWQSSASLSPVPLLHWALLNASSRSVLPKKGKKSHEATLPDSSLFISTSEQRTPFYRHLVTGWVPTRPFPKQGTQGKPGWV